MFLELLHRVAPVFFGAGALQALLLLWWLRSRPGRRDRATRLLMGILAGVTGVLLHHTYYALMPPENSWRYTFNGLAAACWFLIPVVYWWYVRELTAAPKIRRSLHGLLLLPGIYFAGTFPAALGGWWFPGQSWMLAHPAATLYGWVGGYVVIGLICCTLARRQLRDNPTIRTGQRWLIAYTDVFITALLLSGLTLLILALYNRYDAVFEYTLLLCFSYFAFAVTYRSLRHQPHRGILSGERYGRAAAATEELEALGRRLERYMQTASPHLNPELRLADLAAGLGAAPNDLSQLFSRHLQTNFYGYVNQHRINAVEKALREGALERLNMTGLANACGFKSKAPLYREFRNRHATTPVDWLRRQTVTIEQ